MWVYKQVVPTPLLDSETWRFPVRQSSRSRLASLPFWRPSSPGNPTQLPAKWAPYEVVHTVNDPVGQRSELLNSKVPGALDFDGNQYHKESYIPFAGRGDLEFASSNLESR